MLTNIAPSMFVPLTDEFLDKHFGNPPRNRIETLKRILESIDFQRAGVKENLLAMVEREKQRRVLLAQELHADFPGAARLALNTREADDMIAKMESPALQGIDYSMVLQPPDHDPDRSIHDSMIEDLLMTAEGMVRNLEGYEQHIAGCRKKYQDYLEAELMRISQAGLRPEERHHE